MANLHGTSTGREDTYEREVPRSATSVPLMPNLHCTLTGREDTDGSFVELNEPAPIPDEQTSGREKRKCPVNLDLEMEELSNLPQREVPRSPASLLVRRSKIKGPVNLGLKVEVPSNLSQESATSVSLMPNLHCTATRREDTDGSFVELNEPAHIPDEQTSGREKRKFSRRRTNLTSVPVRQAESWSPVDLGLEVEKLSNFPQREVRRPSASANSVSLMANLHGTSTVREDTDDYFLEFSDLLFPSTGVNLGPEVEELSNLTQRGVRRSSVPVMTNLHGTSTGREDTDGSFVELNEPAPIPDEQTSGRAKRKWPANLGYPLDSCVSDLVNLGPAFEEFSNLTQCGLRREDTDDSCLELSDLVNLGPEMEEPSNLTQRGVRRSATSFSLIANLHGTSTGRDSAEPGSRNRHSTRSTFVSYFPSLASDEFKSRVKFLTSETEYIDAIPYDLAAKLGEFDLTKRVEESRVNFTSQVNRATSSSARASVVYDVVLSFRGEDTRLNFTNLLYRALIEKGILTFRSSTDQWRGHEIDPGFIEACGGSRILIPIISKGYASSQRCLLELEQMLQRKRTGNQLVWPVFFGVDPSDVRRQTGSFKEIFMKYELGCDVSDVMRWREALREIASLKGYVVHEREGFETVKLIVERALMGLVAMTGLEELDDTTVLKGYPDGTDFHIECMLQLLHLDSMDVRFVGICGLHESMKAIIAETIYYKILNRFEGSSFIANVNAQAVMPPGLVFLQNQVNQLLSDTLMMKRKFRTANLGSMSISEQLRAKKVLIVLDGVGDCMQINALLHNANWFGAGSRVIITTTDERLLEEFKVDVIYRPEILDEYQSLVLGSKLLLHSINEVERTLQKINDASDDRLRMINLLSHRGRQIILNEKSKEPVQCNDTAENNYFFIHLFVWGQCKGLTVLNLSNCSSLVKIPDISSLQLLKRLILEDCHELFDVHESIGMIKGLMYLNLRACCKLVQLQGSTCQFVALENLTLSGCGSLKRLPEWSSNLKSLVVLDLSSTKISELPDGVGLMEKLVILNVNGCINLVKLPRSMGKMRQLQHFNMSRTGIMDLPDDFLMLPSLNILEMAKCVKFKGFPSNGQYTSCVSCLSCLQVLDLEHCKRLESLPELSSALLKLNVLGCRSLPVINLCNLHNLKAFCFGGCDKMVEMPYGFAELFLLEKLVLCLISSDCLLATVLSSLKHLALLDCRNLKSLPELPPGLIELQLIGCVSLEKLPNLTSLKILKVLNLTGCAKLKEIQGLEELKSLTLYDVTLCYSLTETPVKVLGQGTIKDESFGYELGGGIIHTYFVISDDMIDQLLVMCLAFSSGHSTTDSCFHGLSDDCILQFEASITRDGRQIDCINDLVVNVNMSSKDEMLIYIHYFKGCDWFGFPLLHGDVIEKLKISSLTGEWNLEFFHLLMEPVLQTPSQQPSVEKVKLLFNWTDEMDNTALHRPKLVDGKTVTTLSRMRQYCWLPKLH